MRMRWLWLQKTDSARSWSALQINVEPEVRAFFEASVTLQLGNGERILFWLDKWIDGQSISQLAPGLFDCVPKRTKNTRTVAQALTDRRWTRDFRGGLSIPLLLEYIELSHRLALVQLTDTPDLFRWRWTADGIYSSASAYKKMHEGSIHLRGARRIWRSWAPPKVKFFTWLATKKRLWTADRRRRRGLEAHDECWFCNQEAETCDHILVHCSYAKQIWWNMMSCMDCHCSFPNANKSLQGWWSHVRRLQQQERRRGMDTLFMLIIWGIWKERNSRLFRNCYHSAEELLVQIKQEAELWIAAGATRLGCLKRE
ncbi:unnamed protein product [Urochloa humidicola]